MGQLNKAGNLLCERLKEFHEISTDDKLKSLENMGECVRTNKEAKIQFFWLLEEYRGSKGPLTKATNNKEKSDIFARWMANQLRSEKGGHILNMWMNYGVKSVRLGILDGFLVFTEAVMAVARPLQNPVGRAFMVERMEELMYIPDEFLGLFDDGELIIAAKRVLQ